MNEGWTFWDYIDRNGKNEIHEWLNSRVVSKKAKAKINARIAAMRGMTVFPDGWISAYNGWDGLYEMRIGCHGVQYRPFGSYGPHRRQFSFLVGSIEKGGVIPQSDLQRADERRKIVIADPGRVTPHDFR